MNLRNCLYGSAATAMVLVSGHAAAQTALAGQAPEGTQAAATGQAQKDAPGALGDIVVTARKFAENLQKAPASVVAVGSAELLQRGIVSPQSLEKFLPSTSLRTLGSATQIYIRGIGTRNSAPNFAAASAFVYNGIVIPTYGTFGLTQDLDSVQSIAGPQGTLYGGSAAGGAINLFSAKPHNNFEGSGALEIGDYGAISASIAQNVALSDTLSVRGAFNYNRRTESYFHDGINTQDNYSGRLSVLYKPSTDVSALIFYNRGKDTGRPPVIVTPIPLPKDPYDLPSTGPTGNPIDGKYTFQNNRNDIIGANIDFKIGDNNFTYIPGYVHLIANYQYYGGLGYNQFQYYDRERQHSEELRWNRKIGRLQLNAGLFYLRDLIDSNLHLLVAVPPFVSPSRYLPIQLNTTTQVNESYAAYAQGIYSLTDQLRLTVGGRFTRDKIDAEGIGANRNVIDFHHAHARGDFKAGIDYDILPKVMIYGNVQSGYIPFGYNPDETPNPVLPESRLLALSGGVKSRFLDNHVELNIEGFHYDYKNFQAITFIAATGYTDLLKSQKAEIYGVDISLRAQITPTTQIDGGLVLESAKYKKFQGVGKNGVAYDYSGNHMLNAPSVNLIAGIQKTIELGSQGSLLARVDTHYSSSYFGDYTNVPNTRQPGYHKTDASLTYTLPGGRWSIQGFVRNIEDKAVFTVLSPGTTPADPGVAGLDAPRTYGMRVQIKW